MKLLYILMIFFSMQTILYSPLSYSKDFHTHSINGEIKIKNWREIRDDKIIKQDQDFSCGAASIATVLTEFYNRPTTEEEVLAALGKTDYRASFADMEKALPKFGFKGIGIATSWEQLIELQIPVILYVKQRKQDHFTVISGISNTHVKISDPSLGNRILTRGQFKEIWETRGEERYEGKMLAILPLENNPIVKDETFFFAPKFSHIPTDILTIRDK